MVGLPLGVLIGRSETLNALFDPFVTAFNATPRLVFLPLVLLWFGLGLWSKVVIVFVGAVFPLLINTYEGVRNADRLLINVVRSFGAKEWDIARLVVVPNALALHHRRPQARDRPRRARRRRFGILRLDRAGSASMMVQAASQYKVDIVFAGIIVFTALSLAMTALVKLLEQRLAPLAAAARQAANSPRRRSVQFLRASPTGT